MKPTLILILILPLLASSFQDAEPPDPKTTLERGAYVEEYERDLEKAENLYTLAVEVAQAQGDEATAKAADAALKRVKARRAGAPAAAASQDSDAVVQRIGELLTSFMKIKYPLDRQSPDESAFVAARFDLAVYGDAAVPWLEQLLEPRPIEIGNFLVQLDTRMAAHLLAYLKGDAADAALGRALLSKDPLIRRAVTDEMQPYRHRTLLEQAARDPVPQVRVVAVDKLVRLQDPELLPLILSVAQTGDGDAVKWIRMYAPQRLFDLLAGDPEGKIHYTLLREVGSAQLPPSQEQADTLLRVAREQELENVRSMGLIALTKLLQQSWEEAPAELRAHIQKQLLKAPGDYPQRQYFELLEGVGDLQGFSYVSRELGRWPEERPKEDSERLASTAQALAKRLEPADFDAVAELYRDVPLPPNTSANRLPRRGWHESTVHALSELAKNDAVGMDSLVRGYEGLEGARRKRYLYVVRTWISRQPLLDEPAEHYAPVVPLLRDLIDQESETDMTWATRGLSAANDIESLPRMIELTRWVATQQVALDTIARFCDQEPERASALIGEAVRAGRISPSSIRYLDGPHDLALFKSLWPDMETVNERHSLLNTLVREVDGEEADGLIVELYPEMIPDLRDNAIARFGEHLYEPAIPILGQALEDSDQEVRNEARIAFAAFKAHREALEEFAAWTLGDRAAREQVDELVELLASEDDAVVIGAVKALGAVRGRAALPELVRLLERDNEELKAAVYEAIERIGS